MVPRFRQNQYLLFIAAAYIGVWIILALGNADQTRRLQRCRLTAMPTMAFAYLGAMGFGGMISRTSATPILFADIFYNDPPLSPFHGVSPKLPTGALDISKNYHMPSRVLVVGSDLAVKIENPTRLTGIYRIMGWQQMFMYLSWQH